MNNFFNIAIQQDKPLLLMNGEIAYVKFQLPLPTSWGPKFVGYRITGKCPSRPSRPSRPILETWDEFGKAESSKDFDIWGFEDQFEGLYE